MNQVATHRTTRWKKANADGMWLATGQEDHALGRSGMIDIHSQTPDPVILKQNTIPQREAAVIHRRHRQQRQMQVRLSGQLPIQDQHQKEKEQVEDLIRDQECTSQKWYHVQSVRLPQTGPASTSAAACELCVVVPTHRL